MEKGPPKFTKAEIMVMEKLFKEMGDESLSQKFCKVVATCFSCLTRAGKSAIEWKQVQSWFKDKQKSSAADRINPSDATVTSNATETSQKPKCERVPKLSEMVFEAFSAKDSPRSAAKVTLSPVAFKEFVNPSDATVTSNATKTSQKPKGERVAGLSELVFEALSAKDGAWYDVAAFLNHRVIRSGELEVRVRFSGFNFEEDEWVNVRRGVRERSIPLEPSECHRVKVGDLVLCFRESDDEAIYCDAHIVKIQRKTHDIKGCRCMFFVRYDNDNSKGKVQLSSLCCRPT